MGKLITESTTDVTTDREESAGREKLLSLVGDIAALRFPDDPERQRAYVERWERNAEDLRQDPVLDALREEVAVRDRAARTVRLLTAYARHLTPRYRWREIGAALGVGISTVQGYRLDDEHEEVQRRLSRPAQA